MIVAFLKVYKQFHNEFNTKNYDTNFSTYCINIFIDNKLKIMIIIKWLK